METTHAATVIREAVVYIQSMTLLKHTKNQQNF